MANRHRDNPADENGGVVRCIGIANPNSGLQDLSAADVTVHSIREFNVQNRGQDTGVTG